MKNRLFCLAVASFLLFSCGSGGEHPSSQTASDTAAPPVAALRVAAVEPCAGLPLPAACADDCQSAACYSQILKQHLVTDTVGYEKELPPFTYKDLSFGGLLSKADCHSIFIFEIYREQPGGPALSHIALDTAQYPEARSFPVSLMRAIAQKHSTGFKELSFYWLQKSPRCPAGNDVLMDVVQEGNKHTFYNMSDPPTK